MSISSHEATELSSLVMRAYERLLDEYANGRVFTREDIIASVQWLIDSGISTDNPLLDDFFGLATQNFLW